jgi:hypothetical protein
MRALAVGMFAVGIALASPTSWAEPTAEERGAARLLAEQGDAAWDAGDYAIALERFTRAYQLVPVPSLAFRQAECLTRVGRLVEASEKFAEISRVQLEPNAPAAFQNAVRLAREQAEALRQRLSLLRVVVEGDNLDGAELRVGGKPIPRTLWGTSFPVDPGRHTIVVTKGDRRAERDVELREKGSDIVVITLPKAGAADAPPPEPTRSPPAPAPREPATPQRVGADSGSPHATWGYVGLAVGGAGLAAGIVTGAILYDRKTTLDEECLDGRCPPSEKDQVDRFNRLRPIPTIGFGVGLLGVGTGLILLLTAPDEEPRAQRGVQTWVGLGSAGVRGTF